ncbi:MAG TPA: hypothetical protein PKM73_11405 [Verrucomicrobiota bacterium]|nr:hypothetical protein [Verrucomicrobiota bacterium]HNU50552.1 hypothetical protein [Verrucomicrobiota bacterium]
MNQRARRWLNVGLVLWCVALWSAWDGWGQMQFQGSSTRRRSTTSSDYPRSTEVGEAIISSDPETRKLIVVTDEETSKYIGTVISNLDRTVPQVLIKVVFLEVTHRKGLDFGIEGSYTRDLGGSSTGFVNQVFGLAAEGTSPAPPGAGLYQVLGSDFTATLRAIAEAGKTEVLSRPSILARNNQEASITIGQEVPLISDVRYDSFGNQINSVTRENVGILLRVTPFITSDGMVEMVVNPEISNLSDETVTIATGVTQPVINTRSADTVVVTPDGQTVVIGGLFNNTKTETKYKIPLLGDIPLLGAAFRRTVKNDTKTELLIFLTPHIVSGPTQLARLSASEEARAQLVPKTFSEQELDRFLDRTSAREPAPEPAKKKKKQ